MQKAQRKQNLNSLRLCFESTGRKPENQNMKTNQTITKWLALTALATLTRFKIKMLQLLLLLIVAGAAVAITTPTIPQFTGISVSGTTLTLKAANGTPGGQYVLLASTNVAGPWTAILTNSFDGSGNLNLFITNSNPAVHQQFYMLRQ
jgi:hypothetical protein